MRRIVHTEPPLDFRDLEEMRREEGLTNFRRVAALRWRAPKQTKRLRPGDEPSRIHEEALFLYGRTRGH